MSLDLFGTAPPPDPLIGQAICMCEPCRSCGTNVAVVCVARGLHTAGLKCRNCDAQWTAEIDFGVLRNFVAEITSHFGTPAEIKLTTIKQRSKAMTTERKFEAKPNSGALFKNTRKHSETDAEYTGTGNIQGAEFWVNAWVNEAKSGQKYFRLSFKPKNRGDRASTATTSAGASFDDEIPFSPEWR